MILLRFHILDFHKGHGWCEVKRFSDIKDFIRQGYQEAEDDRGTYVIFPEDMLHSFRTAMSEFSENTRGPVYLFEGQLSALHFLESREGEWLREELDEEKWYALQAELGCERSKETLQRIRQNATNPAEPAYDSVFGSHSSTSSLDDIPF